MDTHQAYRLGIDIGGTFTDAVLVDERTGDLSIFKVPSTRREPSRAVVAVLRRIATELGVPPASIRYFVHGTTLATNTIIERSGARTGLLVTQGFKDILEIGRMRMPDILDFFAEAPRPLVERRHVVEIEERVLADGQVRHALDEEEIRTAVAGLIQDGVEGVAVCFLHSYKYAQHERAAGQLIKAEYPALYLALSSEVWPELREYERAIVSVIDAYVGPRMTAYFRALEQSMHQEGVAAPLLVTRSNGGIMTARTARHAAAQTLLSGPASGVMGAAYVGHLAGFTKLIGLDMGGTSADIGIIDGTPLLSTESRVGDFPIVMPAVDVSSIGAGGGSIAWCDSGGVLKVGPQSAGSEPGPACLGRGGEEPTVTDAYLHLGILHPDRFLGGELRLIPSKAEAALAGLGKRLGITALETADAILNVTTAHMYAEFVPLVAKKGIELGEFALFAYGGAGPTHACLFAEETGISRIVVPPSPGTLCAFGALTMDVKADYVRSLYKELNALSVESLEQAYTGLEQEASSWLEREGIAVDGVELLRSADMRYVGQGFDVKVAYPATPGDANQRERLAAAFHDRHHALYRHSDPTAPAEITTLRLTVVGKTPKPPLRERDRRCGALQPKGTRPVYYRGRSLECLVYERSHLNCGDRVTGPCIVEQYDTTTLITPRFAARCDDFGNLILEAVR